MKAWLLLYNLASAVGWAYVAFIVFASLVAKQSAEELWEQVGTPLIVVQSAAVLEIVHSLLRWVRSPLFTTVMQVGSRLWLVWVFTAQCKQCQQHWSLYLMAGSWALVEVPRYLFYAANLAMKRVPYPLFFLRYNLFMVLYPSGISGEMFQMYTAFPFLARVAPALHILAICVFVLYFPGGPFMIMTMFGQRAGANKKRNPRPPPKSGLMWPVTDAAKNARSTTVTNREIFARSLDKVAPDAAAAVRATKNWRFGYPKHVVKNVEVCCSSTKACLDVCKDGLEAAHNLFQMVSDDGVTRSMAEEMRVNTTTTFETGVLRGTKRRAPGTPYVVPYKGKNLSGAELCAQADRWVAYGTIEPSAGEAIKRVANNPDQFLDLSDEYFVLLGATSAMGPLLALLELGANIVAVDLNRPFIWNKLIAAVKNSPGTMFYPLPETMPQSEIDENKIAGLAGCNLLTDTARIRNWLVDFMPTKRLTIGGYAYLDGALHVQLAVSMDAIMAGVSARRADTRLCFLCSPTDVFANADEAVLDAQKNYKNAPAWQKLFENLGVLKPNVGRPVPSDNDTNVTIVNGLVVQQGPNYALAKRIQHWRAMLCRAGRQTVSTNIAPSTATASVVHNSSFAAAYGGMHKFKPMEIFMQETSNAVMCALMLNDVFNTEGLAHGSNPISNPVRLFASTAFHGGIWRIGYRGGTIGMISAAYYYAKVHGIKVLAAVGGLVYLGRYLYTSSTTSNES